MCDGICGMFEVKFFVFMLCVMMIKWMDHVGVVVEDLVAVIVFFFELGMELEGEIIVEGEFVDQFVGFEGV